MIEKEMLEIIRTLQRDGFKNDFLVHQIRIKK